MADLDESNKAQVKRLFNFLKGKRDRHLKEIDDIVADVKDDRCGETIYNQEDVVCLLDEFARMAKDLVRQELDTLGNMMALYASDLLFQGQNQHIQLAGDVNVIEDESRLQQVAELADWQGNAPAPRKPGNLVALGASAGAGDSSGRSELESENAMLRERNQSIQKQLSEMMKERTVLSDELQEIRHNFDQVKSQMGGTMQGSSAVTNMEQQLSNTRQMLENKSSEVERIREDLNKRLGDSNQFKDLKAIVAKKNQQIKLLRDRLNRYEPADNDGFVMREDD